MKARIGAHPSIHDIDTRCVCTKTLISERRQGKKYAKHADGVEQLPTGFPRK